MKVILLKDVKGVGKKQEIVNVKDGYGANYLIPHGLAVMYSEKSLEILENQKADQAAEIAKTLQMPKKLLQNSKILLLNLQQILELVEGCLGQFLQSKLPPNYKANTALKLIKENSSIKQLSMHLVIRNYKSNYIKV